MTNAFIYDFSVGCFRNLRKVYLANANFKFMQGLLHVNEKEKIRQQYERIFLLSKATFVRVTFKLHNENDNEE